MKNLCEDCTLNRTCEDAGEDVNRCDRYRYSYFEHYCLNCAHWKTLYYTNGVFGSQIKVEPHCGLYSCSCATDISNHKTPSRFLERWSKANPQGNKGV